MDLQSLVAQASRLHGSGRVHTILEALATSSSLRCDKTGAGTFLKLYRTGDLSLHQHQLARRTSSKTPASSSTSPRVSSPAASTISRGTLLSHRGTVPELPRGDGAIRAQSVPIKNTFVHFPLEREEDAPRAASEPAPPGLEASSANGDDAFYFGDVAVSTATQTCAPPVALKVAASVQSQALPRPRRCRVNGRAVQTTLSDTSQKASCSHCPSCGSKKHRKQRNFCCFCGVKF